MMNKINLTNKSLSYLCKKFICCLGFFSSFYCLPWGISYFIPTLFFLSHFLSLFCYINLHTHTQSLSLSRVLTLSLTLSSFYAHTHLSIKAYKHTHILSLSLLLSLCLPLSYSLFIAFQLSFISTYTHLSNTQGQKVFGLRQVEC